MGSSRKKRLLLVGESGFPPGTDSPVSLRRGPGRPEPGDAPWNELRWLWFTEDLRAPAVFAGAPSLGPGCGGLRGELTEEVKSYVL